MQFGVAIREDSIVEEAENFSVRVELQEGGTPGVLIGRRREAVVIIEDNDGVCVCVCVNYEPFHSSSHQILSLHTRTHTHTHTHSQL